MTTTKTTVTTAFSKISLLLLLSHLSLSRSEEWSPGCETWPRDFPSQHGDWACDKSIQNNPVELNSHLNSSTEGILGMPEEKTLLCPTEEVLTADDLPSPGGGHETRWIVHNAASNPVVLSWVNHQGIEVSAADTKTNPPAAHAGYWPNGSMLAPGHVAVVLGFPGQTFLARDFLEGGGTKAGRILLKHRTGLVYVRNDKGTDCPIDAKNNSVPSEKSPSEENPSGEDLSGGAPTGGATSGYGANNKIRPVHDAPSGEDAKNKIRSRRETNPNCNFMDKGFINKVGCDIDIYFATGGDYARTPPSFPKGHNPPQCESFSMHLGVNPRPTNHQEDYSSPLKYEITYATHRFVARMSHDNSLVTEIHIDHDIIHDCPDLKAKSSIVSTETNIGMDILTNGDVVVNTDAVPHASGDIFHVANVTETSSFSGLLTKDASKMDMTVKPISHIMGGGITH